jgi:S-adenosylhomocysteine hydrolase
MRAADAKLGGKRALDCGSGDVGECSPLAMRGTEPAF